VLLALAVHEHDKRGAKVATSIIPRECEAFLQPPTILLVEDEGRVRKVMAQVLRSEGYTVLEAATAEQALANPAFMAANPSILITDVMLPGKTGRQLALDLRQLVPGIRTLMVSGYGESIALMGTENTNEISYLPKPFSAASLLAAVRNTLRSESLSGRRTG
jgi:DNA-binding response OmpR family regulator